MRMPLLEGCTEKTYALEEAKQVGVQPSFSKKEM